MHISRNDGLFNEQTNHTKDLVINMNTMVNLSRKNYSEAQLRAIKEVQLG